MKNILLIGFFGFLSLVFIVLDIFFWLNVDSGIEDYGLAIIFLAFSLITLSITTIYYRKEFKR